jgi:hypothetical protein
LALSLLGAVITAPGVFVIWAIYDRARALAVELHRGRSVPSGADEVNLIMRHIAMREHLRQVLLMLGILVGIVTLTTGALRNAYIAWLHEDISVEVVWIFGGYFTVVLALVFIPTYVQILSAGARIRDLFHPIVAPDSPDYESRQVARDRLEELLQLQVSPTERLKGALPILAPLVGSFLSVLLGTS